MNNLYVMALYAVKPDPECMDVIEQEEGRIGYRICCRDGEMKLSSPIGLAAHVEIAKSAADAKQMGLDTALEMWPRSDGWIGHAVTVKSRSLQELMRESFGSATNVPFEGEETDENEASELVM
jgi:hypothetical protein